MGKSAVRSAEPWSDDKKRQVLEQANELSQPYGLRAEFVAGGEIMTVGVQGDDRSYTPVIVLIGPDPGQEVLASLSTRITNALPVNRVTWELATSKPEEG